MVRSKVHALFLEGVNRQRVARPEPTTCSSKFYLCLFLFFSKNMKRALPILFG
jgi:hypothetical protein